MNNFSTGKTSKATNPFAIIADASDNLYLPDISNQCIIKENATVPANDSFRTTNNRNNTISYYQFSNQYYI